MNKKIIYLIGIVLLPLILLPLLAFFTDELYVKYWEDDAQPTVISNTIASTAISETSKLITPSILAYSVDGFDWSLPKNTPISQNSGLIAENEHDLSFAQNVFTIVRWDEANPRKGVYDFTKFEESLVYAGAKKALVRLEVNSICETPKWAQSHLRYTPDKSLVFWDDAYIELLKPFVQAFSARYANDPRIIGVQLGIGDGEYTNNACDFSNKDGWGEFWMTPKAIALAESEYGLTPSVFEKQSKQIIDVYADAFAKQQGKLAFTNIGPTFSWTDIAIPYNKKLRKIAQYVWEKGIGNRDGQVEIWMRYIDKAYGVNVRSLADGSCYLGFDEDYANQMRYRYSGTENEFYGNKDYVIDANGPYENQAYRFFVSSLRSLQMRRNFISIDDDAMKGIKDPSYKTQDFLRYLNLVLGKQIENTPDVFVLLGERYVAPSFLKEFKNEPCIKNSNTEKGVPIRSFGRWLTETSKSKPSLKVSLPESENYWGQDYTMPNGVDFEFMAREGKKFSFDINDKLIQKRCKQPCKVEIKITFKDTTSTKIKIFYDNKVQFFNTKGDNRIKTVTYYLKSNFDLSRVSDINSHLSNINKKGTTDFMVSSQKSLPYIMTRVNFL